jgi:hypothetical protein
MIEVLKQLVDALENHSAIKHPQQIHYRDSAIQAGKQAIAQLALDAKAENARELGLDYEQEPVAWMLTDKNINLLQVDSIQRLIDRLKHAHNTDLCVRINGQDEWFQADWLKHMVRVTPPQRTEPIPAPDIVSEKTGELYAYSPELVRKIFSTTPPAQPPPRTEPFFKFRECEDSQAGIAIAPQRTWVGLTLDEIALIHANYSNPQGFALALQAKLKELNT